MLIKIKNIIELMLYAKNTILSSEPGDSAIEHFLYEAQHDESINPGVLKGVLLPSNEPNKGYFSYEYYGSDGRLLYGMCVYDYETETVFFTGWYNICTIVTDEFTNSFGPNDINPYLSNDSEE